MEVEVPKCLLLDSQVHRIRTNANPFYCLSQNPRIVRPFMFLNMWLRHESCKDLITNKWQVDGIVDTEILVRPWTDSGKTLKDGTKPALGE